MTFVLLGGGGATPLPLQTVFGGVTNGGDEGLGGGGISNKELATTVLATGMTRLLLVQRLVSHALPGCLWPHPLHVWSCPNSVPKMADLRDGGRTTERGGGGVPPSPPTLRP